MKKQRKTTVRITYYRTSRTFYKSMNMNIVVAHEDVKLQRDPIKTNLAVRVLNAFSTSARIIKHEVIGHIEGA